MKLKEKGSLRKKKEEDDLISYQSGNETIIMPTRFKDYSLGSTMVYLLIGLLIGGLTIGFLVVPSVERKAKEELKQQVIEVNDALSANEQLIKTQTARIAELEAQIVALQGSAGALPAQTAAYEALLSAYVAFVGNDNVTAGANLETVDSSQLSPTALATYNSLSAAVMEKYYASLYDTGYQYYVAENFPEAITYLLKVVNKDMGYKKGSAAYYLAQAYRRGGDIESARPYYQYVVDNYPGTKLANTAKNYVNGN